MMHIRQRLKLQHTLTAIRLGAPIVEIADQLERSSERTSHGSNMDYNSATQAPWLHESLNILDRFDFSSKPTLRYEYPQEICPPQYRQMSTSFLRDLVS
jgi:error-prone DNA polymerase